MLTHSYQLKFCQAFESLYGKGKVTPNMHLHTHLVDCVLDYGPVYAFWLFSFERYNGILGEFKTNQLSVEIQIMRKFTCNQFIQDMPLPSVFKNVFNPILDRLASNQAGTLPDQSLPGKDLSSTVIKVNLLSIGPVRKCVEYACTDSFFTCCGLCSRSNVDAYALPHLTKCYNAIFDGVDETSVQHALRSLPRVALMVIYLVQVLQEVTAHHLCWQDGANLVASLIHLAEF